MATHLALPLSVTTTAVTGVPGGRYIWTVNATAYNSATVALQALGPDGATYTSVTTKTADGSAEVLVGNNATLKLSYSGGTPTSLTSVLAMVEG